MLVFIKIKSLGKGLGVMLAIIGTLAWPMASNAQVPASKAHTIDKSKLAIHQNYRDAQPQRFSNNRSKIVEFASNGHTRFKASPLRSTAAHTKNTTTATVKDPNIKRAKKVAKAKAVHHIIRRKAKTH